MKVEATPRSEVDRLRRKLDRALAENSILESMIEDQTRSLFVAHQELQIGKEYLENVLTSLSAAVLTTNHAGTIRSIAGRTSELTGRSSDELIGQPIATVFQVEGGFDPDMEGVAEVTLEANLLGPDGRVTPVLVTGSHLAPVAGHGGVVYTAIDLTDRRQLEGELRQAQRLESIGSMAAGVAHEINTPIQFVSDSVRFMADAIDDLFEMDRHREELCEVTRQLAGGEELVARIERKANDLDLSFTKEELPAAVERALSGMLRVSSIVRAMRGFSHPGEDVLDTDLNQLVQTALTLAHHEYKYVATVEFEPGELPTVRCNKLQVSQVLVNLLINAAHAIEDHHAASGTRGHIRLSTERDGDGVRIDVSDDGGGVAEGVRDRIFEPFFTTKASGRGTGQGLALAYRTVVEGHQGRLTVDVDDGIGTTFHLWLPSEVRR